MTSYQWAYTDTKSTKTVFTWTIRNFSRLSKAFGDGLSSPVFYAGENNEHHFRLEIYPNGKTEGKDNEIPLNLRLVTSSKSEIMILFRLYIPDPKTNDRLNAVESRNKYYPGLSFGKPNFINKSDASKYMKNDALKICCEITTQEEAIIISSSSTAQAPKLIPLHQNQLAHDLWQLYKESKDADVVIIVGAKEFCAHKLILTARSSVFAAMFEHKSMVESEESQVEIKDFEPEVVEKMLQFIYTDSVDDVEEIGDKLLAVADKYAIEDLRAVCVQILMKELNIINAAETLFVADLYNEETLKNYVVDFIIKMFPQVVETVGYKNLEERHPKLLRYLIRPVESLGKREHEDVPIHSLQHKFPRIDGN